MNAIVTATRLESGEIVVSGVTHDGTAPIPGEKVFRWATQDHRWVVVRTAGLWTLVAPGATEFKTIPGSVTFHRAYRCEAAAHAEADTLKGGRVVEVQE